MMLLYKNDHLKRQTHRWRDLSFGCRRTNNTTRNRIRATELAVDATMDKAGIPSGRAGLLSVKQMNSWHSYAYRADYLWFKMCRLILVTLLQQAAELHLAVPFPILTGEVFIISFQNIAFIAKILNHCAMRESSTWRGVAGEAPILWLIWRLAHCPWKEKKQSFSKLVQTPTEGRGLLCVNL